MIQKTLIYCNNYETYVNAAINKFNSKDNNLFN